MVTTEGGGGSGEGDHDGAREPTRDEDAYEATSTGAVHEIDLVLEHLDDLFVVPQTDLFSEYRNWLTGMEYAISEAKSRWRRRPVRLVLRVPADEIDDQAVTRTQRAVTRFCEHRAAYNRNEIRAIRRDGVGALAIGLAILVSGLLLSKWIADATTEEWANLFLVNGILLVAAWVGLWYPLDALVYYARPYQLENRALAQLATAEVQLVPRGPAR